MNEYLRNFSLEGKIALITGASYGIGPTIVKTMVRTGTTTVFGDIKQELMDKDVTAYKEEGIEAYGYVCDTINEDAVSGLMSVIEKEVGVIDILVSNTGIVKRIPMCDTSAVGFKQAVDMDFNAPSIILKAVIPGMIKKGHGRIINICSMMSELDRETVSTYAAAGGRLKMLTRNITPEYDECNIQCNGVGPGCIAIPQIMPLREIQPNGPKHPLDQFIITEAPTGRWGEAEDLGGPAVFLVSEASSFVDGPVLYVDGDILACTGKQPR